MHTEKDDEDDHDHEGTSDGHVETTVEAESFAGVQLGFGGGDGGFVAGLDGGVKHGLQRGKFLVNGFDFSEEPDFRIGVVNFLPAGGHGDGEEPAEGKEGNER